MLSKKLCRMSCMACTAQLYQHTGKHAKNVLSRQQHKNAPNSKKNTPADTSVCVQQTSLEICAPFLCFTDSTDLYSMAFTTAKTQTQLHSKLPWDLCPLSSWEMCLDSALSSLSYLSLSSLVSCTLP
jgi:hypothetical protein